MVQVIPEFSSLQYLIWLIFKANLEITNSLEFYPLKHIYFQYFVLLCRSNALTTVWSASGDLLEKVSRTNTHNGEIVLNHKTLIYSPSTSFRFPIIEWANKIFQQQLFLSGCGGINMRVRFTCRETELGEISYHDSKCEILRYYIYQSIYFSICGKISYSRSSTIIRFIQTVIYIDGWYSVDEIQKSFWFLLMFYDWVCRDMTFTRAWFQHHSSCDYGFVANPKSIIVHILFDF